MSRLRVGVVGLGYWGPNIVRVLHELPETTPVAVCDLDPIRLAKVSNRYPGLKATSSFDDLLEDENIEAVAIATGVASHFPLALAALEAGKHVFVEKPMASSLAQVEELCAASARADLVLMPGHTFLYSPPVNLVRDLIESGALGDIYFVSMSRVNLGLHQSDASVIWDLAPHDLSILRHWLDETPVSVSAFSRSCIIPDVPDVAFVSLRFPSSLIAHMELAWLAPSKLRRTAVVGSRKMVIYDDTSNEPVRIFDSGAELSDPSDFGEYRMTYRTGDIVSPRVEVAEPLFLEMADFYAAVRTGSTPTSSAQLGADVVAVIEAIDRSLAAAGDPVAIETFARL